jgi:nucleoside-diphosphate-sugar epimerase
MSDPVTIKGPPSSEEELEDLLSVPTAETITAVSRLEGDVLVLGAGGKMGPSLARLARRSIDAAGLPHRVICVSRWSSRDVAQQLEAEGIETIACDLLERDELERLPDAPEVLYLAGFKFGSSGAPDYTWAMNCYLPAIVAERYRGSRIVAVSTGNVYPLVPIAGGGAIEETPPGPIGEYSQSCLGRERMFQYMSRRYGTRVALIRLNYATDLRYGVLLDIAQKVATGEPIELSVGYLNTIWQGDANAALLQAFELCARPPDVLNVTGPEIVSVRDAANRFAELLGRAPVFAGKESDHAFLGNAGRYHALFGLPHVALGDLIEWTAEWVRAGQRTLGKPTHFETQDGKY